MSELTYVVGTTLDGFIAGPGGGDPSGPDGFWPVGQDYVEFLREEFPETLPHAVRQAIGAMAPATRFDTVLEGRVSYEVGLSAGVADAYPHLRHVVFSRTLPHESADPGVELVRGDPVTRVRELKAGDGPGLWLVGGGSLAGSLYAEIDHLVLKVSPLTLGCGTGLFGERVAFMPRHWTLRRTETLDSGVVVLFYSRAER